MKNRITSLFTVFCLSIIYAQEAQLKENDWYIGKLEISDGEIFPPDVNCSKFSSVFFEDAIIATENLCCETGASSNIGYVATNEFELFGDIVELLDSGCSTDEWAFYSAHISVYFDPANSTFYNPYTYEITDNGDNFALVVTNGNGDKAFYNNFLLNTQSFQDLQINIYPNPVKDRLFIQSQLPFEHLKVYTINGQVVFGEKTPAQSLDVSKLEVGVYFIEIVSQEGKSIKKFIKN